MKRSPTRVSSRRRRVGVLASSALVGALMPALMVTSASPASAAPDPNQISFTLEGCRNNGTILLPDGGGKFICPTAAYTTGNLGKGWNELDLVPHRVTLRNTSATQTYSFRVAGDYTKDAGTEPGWDVISDLVLNSGLSTGSCANATTGATQITPPGEGVGGASQTIHRLVTVAQPVNTTCVYDYYQRLALGASEFSGSSLQSNLWNQSLTSSGIGQKRLSLPVNEIAPQSISKNMAATQGSAFNWLLNKASTPATLGLGNTCDPANTRVGAISTTITWTRVGPAPAGQILVTTNVFATNPAARTITVNVTDSIRSGTTVLDEKVFPAVDVPANSTNFSIGSHTFTVPTGTANLNDVATATYTDLATGIAVPGTTTATASASVTSSGTVTDATAIITDTETLTGGAFEFRITGVTGTAGSFTGYTLGTWTTGPVSWTSGTVSDSGSATFAKQVRTSSATVATGTLSDTATLNGSNTVTRTASASTTLNASATTSATVSKTMNQRFATAKTFTFALFTAEGVDTGKTTSVTIPAGQNGPVTSAAVTGLDPAVSYYFAESATAPFAAQNSGPVSYTLVPGSLASCSATVQVRNSATPPTARVQKITNPVGSTSWTFTLTGPNGLSETKDAMAGAGFVAFNAPLEVDGGTYTITETAQTGWDATTVSGGITGTSPRAATTSTSTRTCAVVLNLTTDADGVLSCTFTNTQRAPVTVVKTVSGSAIPAGSPHSFAFTLTSTGPDGVAGTADDVNASQTADATNGGQLDFGLLRPAVYTLCELQTGAGWAATWQLNGTTVTPVNPDATASPPQDLGTRCHTFTLAPGGSASFAIDNVPPPGGGQRTIGYWKNWNSVSRSAAFLAKHESTHALVDDFIGPSGTPGSIALGNVTVNTVQKAVTILSDASTKFAEHGLAAQLLAAELNVLALAAPTCTTISGVINQADTLLAGINWTDANYATSKIVAAKHPQRTQFVTVHNTLDAYNNGTCPA